MRFDKGGDPESVFGQPMEGQGPIRVLLVDDHRAVLERVKRILSSEFTVVAVASGGLEMLSAFARHNPDVIVTDITIHEISGIEASRKLLESRPGTPIVILSIHREQEVVQNALEAGVMAYVHKLSAGEDLIPAIHCALAGRRFVSDSCKY
jgi:two-component system, NarL family, nitrate/nitrite response regulator NarL